MGCTYFNGYNLDGSDRYITNFFSVRPAFFLNQSKLLENPFVGLDGSGTEDEPYTFVHKHSLTYHAKVDATCTSSGTGEYWKCEGGDGCNKYFSDANGETETTLENTVIAAKGHTWGEWEITKPATETEDGEKTRTCSACGERETQVIPATGTGDTEKFSIRYEGGNAIVNAPTAGTYTVLFAAYDGSGRLTSLSAQTVTVEKGEKTVEPPINFTASGTVKVMLWESLASMKPLCAAGEN